MPAPFRAGFRWSLTTAVLGVVAALCVGASGAGPASAEDDLKAMQGTWERTQVLPDQPGEPGTRTGRVVKVVTGNRETVTTYDADGKVTYAHTVEFRLERQGKVRVFTFFNREVTAGSTKGRKVPEPSSYIYRLTGDTFEEVWGFLPGQEQRDLLAAKWKRARRA
jgi:hypothetical protein